jgi:hypothetical protein
MKKVVEDYIGLISLYKEVTLGVWDLTFKITSWAARILKKLEISLEFYFMKNGNKLLFIHHHCCFFTVIDLIHLSAYHLVNV